MEWIFDGIGTAIVSGLIGMGIGGGRRGRAVNDI